MMAVWTEMVTEAMRSVWTLKDLLIDRMWDEERQGIEVNS